VPQLLGRAKKVIASGEGSLWTSLREAAEIIAVTQARGASQRQIAAAVGKSAAWVNRLNKWRQGGYEDQTPFGPQSKASRQNASGVQASKHKKFELPSGSRDLLVKTLGMLGSDHPGERDNAACTAERLRKEFGLTWDQLIIPANRNRGRS
jgi:transposase